jgi:hypothetical protein
MKLNKTTLAKFVFEVLNEEENKLKKEEKELWVQGAIEEPGSLKKQLGLKKDEKLNSSIINKEINKLEKKDKDPEKKGVQGLSDKDLALFKKLNLAKTLAKLREKKKDKK